MIKRNSLSNLCVRVLFLIVIASLFFNVETISVAAKPDNETDSERSGTAHVRFVREKHALTLS